jgi:DNA-binding response OmpR family regulator
VVEDDIELRELFVELLRDHNIEVVGTGSNGKEADELYRIHHPDIVLIDLMMPLYDGYEGIKRIKERDKNAKIIVVSGSSTKSSMLDKYEINDIVQKPIDMNKIGYVISKLMADTINAKMK